MGDHCRARSGRNTRGDADVGSRLVARIQDMNRIGDGTDGEPRNRQTCLADLQRCAGAGIGTQFVWDQR